MLVQKRIHSKRIKNLITLVTKLHKIHFMPIHQI
uniref:Uncharacterized protein n=1 Tax=Arundo donax TaxID=35708 RepID=A0A0A8YA13_ARUDO